ncbi:GTP 3',8-cyclase MoaA [Sphingomonas sp. BK345]|uniref:GTP 3',8-cyclase MoaA n=1 Tax=Sphingomonas sp. BK345 TaxID=2586980 RepID=UPI001610E886|nr:GTP 3',8-cyclase MoaA [Sphingomonas sp. BK345]MBB3475747.1 cyclic pyranopterin phosphate synthase [Sphingomonas sp. BK345]
MTNVAIAPLIDGHGRRIEYLRISVTDRCDLRCRYCMSERMRFLPRNKVMSHAEVGAIAGRFMARGVRKIRLTGGEPLVRPEVMDLVQQLGGHVGRDLDELTLTTNGTQLERRAGDLHAAGVRRINVSLDSRDPALFRVIARRGDHATVLRGIKAAHAAGLRVKINMVVLAGLNEAEVPDMLAWCGERGFDLSLIETMPLGKIDEDRADRFVPLNRVFDRLSTIHDLSRDQHRSGGPARYWLTRWGTRLGLISPLTANFCDGCNRVRLSTDGRLYTCLGHDGSVDLRAALRGGTAELDTAIDLALGSKPPRHDFRIVRNAAPSVERHMSVTGG